MTENSRKNVNLHTSLVIWLQKVTNKEIYDNLYTQNSENHIF